MTLNLGGSLHDLTTPLVMGILNVTPDSFFDGSRQFDEQSIANRIVEMVAQGVSIIDIGGYSTRPGAPDVSSVEEWRRVEQAIGIARGVAPAVPLSVDTFRAEVARRAVEMYGVEMINDVSGGEADDAMFDTVAATGAAYVLMHARGNPRTMTAMTDYEEVVQEVILWLAQRLERLNQMGVADVVVDPGIGFAKTVEQNFALMRALEQFHALDAPLLMGLSRKSLIYKTLGGTPESSLNGTTVLNTIALSKGASILRVHDVKEAVEAVKLWSLCR